MSSSLYRAATILILSVFSTAILAEQEAEPANPVTAASPRFLRDASQLISRGELQKAEPKLRAVLASVEAGLLPERYLPRCLELLVDIHRHGHRNADALPLVRRLRAHYRRESLPGGLDAHRNRQTQYLQMADVLSACGHDDEAESCLREALSVPGGHRAANPAWDLQVYMRLALLKERVGERRAAERSWLQAEQLSRRLAEQLRANGWSDARRVRAAQAIDDLLRARGRTEDSLDMLRELDESLQPGDSTLRTTILAQMAAGHEALGQLDECESCLREARRLQHESATDSWQEAELVDALAALAQRRGKFEQARDLWRQSATVCRRQLGKLHENGRATREEIVSTLRLLRSAQQHTDRISEAIPVTKLLISQLEPLGEDHPQLVAARCDLGTLYGRLGNYQAARPLLASGVDFWRERSVDFPRLASALNNLAAVEQACGNVERAIGHYEDAIDVLDSQQPRPALQLAESYNNLATARASQGNFARAIDDYRQAIDMARKAGTGSSEVLCTTLLNLAMVHKSQGQLEAAVRYCRKSLETRKEAFGEDAPGLAADYAALAALEILRREWASARKFAAQAVAICRRQGIEADPLLATSLHQAALVDYRQGDVSAAQRTWEQVLELREKLGQPAATARTLVYLAKSLQYQGRDTEAETALRRAVELQQQDPRFPTTCYLAHCELGKLVYAAGDKKEARALVRSALDFTELPRAATTGGEQHRAEFFSQYGEAFDLLVSWSLQDRDYDEALAYAERGRNRTLMDQLQLAGVDLRTTLTGPQAVSLLDQERRLQSAITSINARLTTKGGSQQSSTEDLVSQLRDVREQYVEVWRSIRDQSPLYRESLRSTQPLCSSEQIHEQLLSPDNLMLYYHFGSEESFLFLFAPDRAEPVVCPLVVTAEQAQRLEATQGPLTNRSARDLVMPYLERMRRKQGERGPGAARPITAQVLSRSTEIALTDVLLPSSVREQIRLRAPGYVFVIRHGILHELPLEALLVSNNEEPQYLLDVLPPLAYAPSATTLASLVARSPPTERGEPPSVLTVGNIVYAAAETGPGRIETARELFLTRGGTLDALPATALECRRVVSAFDARHVTFLQGAQASEANVTEHLAGKRIIHFATHGLVDPQFENLFGALALHQPRAESAQDNYDGFLAAHEVFSLNLQECELAVLSACSTNVGPHRPLESASTLSQAFFAAGAQRVVSSHWQVSDESTAELIGTFMDNLAEAISVNENVSFAECLFRAKKQIRHTHRWSDPFYWAPFILQGPAEDLRVGVARQHRP